MVSSPFKALVACGLLHFCCTAVAGAEFTIDWYVIGGGSASSNSLYTLQGTTGQLEAGMGMSSGLYTITGGFWALPIVIQTDGAPLLYLVPGPPGFVRISWSPQSTAWVLQESPDLSPATWTYAPTGSANPVIVPVLHPARYYRLVKP